MILSRLLLWLSGAGKEYKKVKKLTQKDSWINMEKNLKKSMSDLKKASEEADVAFKELMQEQKDSSTDIKDNNSVADEIFKLAELKEKGLLTDEEFKDQKNKLLKQK